MGFDPCGFDAEKKCHIWPGNCRQKNKDKGKTQTIDSMYMDRNESPNNRLRTAVRPSKINPTKSVRTFRSKFDFYIDKLNRAVIFLSRIDY